MLTPFPPTASALSVRPGDRGWYVFALQTALVELGFTITVDEIFGPQTEAAARSFQAQRQLYLDGVAGPATQARLVAMIGALVESHRPNLAAGLLRGLSQLEASGVFSVVNWAIAGGVDCGPLQRRVYERESHDYDPAAIASAFDTKAQFELLADQWTKRKAAFIELPWANDDEERAGRCAALAHNWPEGAEAMAKNGAVPKARSTADWIPRDSSGVSLVHFPDGRLVETRGQWAAWYAMGGAHGPSYLDRYVTNWR